MVTRLGINGFGRIGRVIFRTCFWKSDIQVVAINDPAIDIEYICYLIKFDSTHGKFRGNVTFCDNEIQIDDKTIKIFHEKLPINIPWQTVGAHYVVEASGMFTNLEKASGHLSNGEVYRVFVTAPSVDIPMLIVGVNEHVIGEDLKVVSCASSTLYCLAPIVKLLEDNYGISEGFITSIHAMTPSLKPLDGLCLKGKHWRDHRSIHQNIIPAVTGACKALGRIIPSVKDKMSGVAFRVPIVNVSVLDISIRLSTNTTLEDIIKTVENNNMRNIIKTSNEEAVSSDFLGEDHSCILDINSSIQLNPNFYKLICWYENEYSYACRVIDAIKFSDKQLRYNLKSLIARFQPKPIATTESCRNKCIAGKYSFDLKHSSQYSSNIQDIDFKNKITQQKNNDKNSMTILTKKLPLNSLKRTKDVLKVWNENNINATRQNPSPLFHSCYTFAPNLESVYVKSQDRLQKVKEQFNKMINMTEDLLKQSTSSKHSNETSVRTDGKIENSDVINPKNDLYQKSNAMGGDCNIEDSTQKLEKALNLKDNKDIVQSNAKIRAAIGDTAVKTLNDEGHSPELQNSLSMVTSDFRKNRTPSINGDDSFDIPSISSVTHVSTTNSVRQDCDIVSTLSKLLSRPVNIGFSSSISQTNDNYFNKYTQSESNVKIDACNQHCTFKGTSYDSIPSNYSLKIIENDVSSITKTAFDNSATNANFTLEKEPTDIIPEVDAAVVGSEDVPCPTAVDNFTDFSIGTQRHSPDIYDKLDSSSETDTNQSFDMHARKSEVININDLTNSLEDLARLDKICKIMEISDDLSDKLFSALKTSSAVDSKKKTWSFNELCEKIHLDDFCNKVFGQ